MKKSEIYKVAQKAVLNYQAISEDKALEVLKELMDKEDLELFVEQQAEGGDNK
jgi:hypothetical protein